MPSVSGTVTWFDASGALLIPAVFTPAVFAQEGKLVHVSMGIQYPANADTRVAALELLGLSVPMPAPLAGAVFSGAVGRTNYGSPLSVGYDGYVRFCNYGAGYLTNAMLSNIVVEFDFTFITA